MGLQVDQEFVAAIAPLLQSQKDAPKPKLHDIEGRRARYAGIKGPPPVVPEDVIFEIVKIPTEDGYQLPIYQYRKRDSDSSGILSAAVIHAHGGGLITLTPEISIERLAHIVSDTGVQAFSVDYRLAPESRYPTALIIGRAIAGIGSAGIFSGAVLIIVLSVPMRQRPTYIGILAAMYGVSSVAGPLMGGAFTDKLTWRWCFYINLPLGFLTLLFVALLFNPPHRSLPTNSSSWKERFSSFDLEGSVCFLPAIISLLLALQWGGSRYPWSDGRIIGLFVVFGVLIALFAMIQWWKKDKATVPPRILSDRTVWSCAAFAVCFGGSFFLLVYYVYRPYYPSHEFQLTLFQIPIWFQAIKGASAVRSGIMNLPMILGLVIISVLAGGAVSALGYYTPLILASAVLMSIGAGLLTTFRLSTSSPAWIGYQALYGIGAGLGMQLPLVAVQTALAEHDIPIGTATLMFSQTLGGSVFVQVAQNVFTNQLTAELRGVGVDPKIILSVGATELRDRVSTKALGIVLVAYNKALTDTWYVSVATAVLALMPAVFIPWKSVKSKNAEAPAA
ncbi:hypothetical protein NM208_g3096 [Fusarium decemcellulare]|uniref:Uncharacterized protein n=1 Tax=Fusarium decemcellulare TaxID=57161 RepID=A0ACC1SQ90_9HYPO|nr:hypothetical protein NM208_g3096 [Fusarium decemcellulare]